MHLVSWPHSVEPHTFSASSHEYSTIGQNGCNVVSAWLVNFTCNLPSLRGFCCVIEINELYSDGEYPFAPLRDFPEIALPNECALEVADRSLIRSGSGGEKPKAVPAPNLDSIRFPIRETTVYGEAIARLAGPFSGPGFNLIFRPHSDKEPDKRLKLTLPGVDLLELNLTHELWTFPSVRADLGDIPSRVAKPGTEGKARADVFLRGIPYTQIVRDVTDTSIDKGKGVPVDRLGKATTEKKQNFIHFEPGLLIHVPNSAQVSDSPTICRMASIPHGTTINAQGAAAVKVDGKSLPDIPFSNTAFKPFQLDNTGVAPFFDGDQFKLDNDKATRLPQDMQPFLSKNSNESITQKMVQDPNKSLIQHNAGKKFSQVIKFTVATTPTKPLEKQSCPHLAARAAMKASFAALDNIDKQTASTASQAVKNELAKAKKAVLEAQNFVNEPVAALPPGQDSLAKSAATAPAIGSANIAFLDGDLAVGANPNAKVGKVESTFWISTVVYSLDVKEKFVPGKGSDGKSKVLQLSPVEKDKFAKDTVPDFVFPPDKPVDVGR